MNQLPATQLVLMASDSAPSIFSSLSVLTHSDRSDEWFDEDVAATAAATELSCSIAGRSVHTQPPGVFTHSGKVNGPI